MTDRKILHLYDLDHYESERKYSYPHIAFYVGWSAQEMNDTLVERCHRLNVPEVWTFQKMTERTPRFRQWHFEEGIPVKRDCWDPPLNFLLHEWRPDIHLHFVYQIKKHLGFTTNDVYVSSDHLEDLRSLTTLGVHLT